MYRSRKRNCDGCINSADAFSHDIKLNLEGSQKAGTALGVGVTVLFLLAMVYYLAFKSLRFTQLPYNMMLPATRHDYFLPNNTEVQHHIQDNNTDIDLRLHQLG